MSFVDSSTVLDASVIFAPNMAMIGCVGCVLACPCREFGVTVGVGVQWEAIGGESEAITHRWPTDGQ